MAQQNAISESASLDGWVQQVGRLQSQLYAPFVSWLSQPILPGWSFGNITVNEQNSRSPSTEYEVVSQYSYGQQLGRLMDAVKELIEHEAPNAPQSEAYQALLAMADEIDTIKEKTTVRRAQRLQDELRRLKEKDYEEYQRLLEALRPDLT